MNGSKSKSEYIPEFSMMMPAYDLAIVGSGLSCSMSLYHLAERLKGLPTGGNPLRIAVIEKEREVWNGVPYGKRSTRGALTFQRLQEFLEEPERSHYIGWLVANADSWRESFLAYGGSGALQWFLDNQSFIDQGTWEELYLPRFLFGLYISDRTARAVKELSITGRAVITTLCGEATDMLRDSAALFTIVVESSAGAHVLVQAAKVILAIGSPPQRSIYPQHLDKGHGCLCIDDLYSPSEDASIQRIEQSLRSTGCRPASILVLGSNASALEVLYLLRHRPEIRQLIGSIVVLSHSGMLPYKVREDVTPFDLVALRSLQGSCTFSAKDLMAAIISDLARAQALDINLADLRDPVGMLVNGLITRMPIHEQEEFVCRHGFQFSRLMRRAGRDTRSAADDLVRSGLLTMIKGRFRRLTPHPSNPDLLCAVYSGTDSRSEITFALPFNIAINCGGFEELDLCSSRFINSLVRNKLCTVNSTKRGFLVNERLEASENVYVIGPLVAGNFNNKVRFWHVESASRIIGLAKLLAESLHDAFSSAERSPPTKVVNPTEDLAASVIHQYL